MVIGAYVFMAHAKISFTWQGEREGECESERARRERAMTELFTTAEMAQADRRALAGGVAGMELMEDAGRAVADNVSSRHMPGSRIAVVVGPGNNGGDGLVAARLLRERGYRLRVLLLGDLSRFQGDVLQAAHRWNGPCERATPAALTPGEVIVDALFGAGLDRPVEGSARDMIEAMNTGAFVHAVDLPRGLNGNTGAFRGAAVRASKPITFSRRKLGHVLWPGRRHCGKIHVADIG